MALKEPPLEDKKAFFAELDSLNDLSESDNEPIHDTASQKERLQWKQALYHTKTQKPRGNKSPHPFTQNPHRSHSFPSHASGTSSESAQDQTIQQTPLTELDKATPDRSRLLAADIVMDTPIQDFTRSPLQKNLSLTKSAPFSNPLTRQLSSSRPDSSSSSGSFTRSSKRKRDVTIKLVSEEERIFKGLAFYFIPNDDIAPARRMRIRKAQEYGATWTRTLKKASHVVVDKILSWKNIEAILSSVNGSPSAVIVNETYPLDCIQFRALLNPAQNQYHVSGSPGVSTEANAAAPSPIAKDNSTCNDSLLLKPPPKNPRKWDDAPPQATPPRPADIEEHNAVVEASAARGVQRAEPSTSASAPASTSAAHHLSNDDPSEEKRENRKSGQGDSTFRQSPSQNDDELADCISQMQQFRDLPLEEEEEADIDTTSATGGDASIQGSDSEEGGSNDERDRDRKKRKAGGSRSGRNKVLAWEEKFACHRGGIKDGDKANPNARTIEILQRMCDYYGRINDTWRPIAYRKVISLLKRHPIKIVTADEAIRLPGVGPRLADKIEEIVMTDRLRRLENVEMEPSDETLQLFLGIYGVGNAQASLWVAQGYRTLDDLREKAKLTANQKLGVERYADLNTRIPRWEVKALGDVVMEAAKRVDPALNLIVGGSYRRGAESSGDIDLVVTKPGTVSAADLAPLLRRLTAALEEEGFLVARLASSSSRNESDGSKWQGCCVLPAAHVPPGHRGVVDNGGNATATTAMTTTLWRRIDFLAVPDAELGAALLYFTGNDIFNRSMRLLASRKGMRLNQRGLYKDVMRGPGRAKVTEGELVEGRDERRIFEILGVQWREPHDRWC